MNIFRYKKDHSYLVRFEKVIECFSDIDQYVDYWAHRKNSTEHRGLNGKWIPTVTQVAYLFNETTERNIVIPIFEFLNNFEPADEDVTQALNVVDKLMHAEGQHNDTPSETNENEV